MRRKRLGLLVCRLRQICSRPHRLVQPDGGPDNRARADRRKGRGSDMDSPEQNDDEGEEAGRHDASTPSESADRPARRSAG